MRRRTLLVAALAPALARPAPGAQAGGAQAAAAQPKIVATFSVLGDMVRQIGGDVVSLTVIVGPNGDTESYEPTAADARAIAEADLLVTNGLNPEFEPWLDPLLKQAQFGGPRVVASDGVRVLKKAEEGSAHAAGAGEIDQHAWQDVANGVVYARNITAALARLDAARADEYRKRGDAYGRELTELDGWAKQRIASVPAPKRRVIASHDGFGYLARAYGITIVAARGWTNDKEPTAAETAQLIRQIKQDRIRAIFVENMNDPRLVQRVARESGAEIGGELYSDALSKPGEDGDTYVKMVRHNIDTLRAGMLKN